MGKLEGKVAILTASTDGIGLAIAKKLGQEGAKVVVSSRKVGNVNKAVDEIKALGYTCAGCVCHVGNKEDRERLIRTAVDQFGGIDIVVSNAAFHLMQPEGLLKVSEAEWDEVMHVNIKSTFFFCKEVFPYLEKRSGGSIVLVSSLAAYRLSQRQGVYAISKTALLGLTKAMASELGKSKIRVNCLAPGLIRSEMSREFLMNEKAVMTYLKQTPIKRIGTPDDCAGIVAFLASEEASFITGETVVVSGGVFSRL